MTRFSFEVVFCESNRFVSFHCIAEAFGLVIVVFTVLISILYDDSPVAFWQLKLNDWPRASIAVVHIFPCARFLQDCDAHCTMWWMELGPICSALVCDRKCNIIELLSVVKSWMLRFIEALCNPNLVLTFICPHLAVISRLITLVCRLNQMFFKVKLWYSINDLLLLLDEVP